jgi:hypothetical protein
MTGMDQNFHYDKKFKLTPNAQFSHKDVLNSRNDLRSVFSMEIRNVAFKIRNIAF